MSKSRGNVVSPVEYIEEDGADALRFALVAGLAPGADQQFSDERHQNARHFANKLWNVGRYILRAIEQRPGALQAHALDKRPIGELAEPERWIVSRVEATTAEATRFIEGYQFGEYAALMQQFVWGELADVYLELSKPGLRDQARADSVVRTLAYALDRTLRLLHPIVPFVTETLALQLWRGRTKTDTAASLVVSRWPAPGARDAALEDRFGLVVDVVRAIRTLRQDAGIDPSGRVTVTLGGQAEPIRWAAEEIGTLTNADVSFGAGEGAAAVVRTIEVRVAVRRDAAAERARLERELGETRAALERSRELLAKPDFAERAPRDVVEKERGRLAEREQRVRMLEEELRRI
jgi:valyl-tRNA synthetase